MVTSLLRALALLSLALTALAGEPKLAVLDVSGMSCSLCPITVRKALKRVPGVLDVSADLASKSAHVKYDPDTSPLIYHEGKYFYLGDQVPKE